MTVGSAPNGRDLVWVPIKRTWDEAAADCMARGGELAYPFRSDGNVTSG